MKSNNLSEFIQGTAPKGVSYLYFGNESPRSITNEEAFLKFAEESDFLVKNPNSDFFLKGFEFDEKACSVFRKSLIAIKRKSRGQEIDNKLKGYIVALDLFLDDFLRYYNQRFNNLEEQNSPYKTFEYPRVIEKLSKTLKNKSKNTREEWENILNDPELVSFIEEFSHNLLDIPKFKKIMERISNGKAGIIEKLYFVKELFTRIERKGALFKEEEDRNKEILEGIKHFKSNLDKVLKEAGL